MESENGSAERREGLRVGIVATDPMRVLGLQTILEGWDAKGGRGKATLVPLSLPDVLQDGTLSVLILDAQSTGHLFVLLETLWRARPQLRVIVMGESDEFDYIQRVIGAGAKGYLSHRVRESEIRMALEIVSDGSVWAPRKVLARLLDAAKSTDASESGPGIQFTERESEVLRLLVAGMGNREIAQELKIDGSTVKAHLSRLMRKVGAKNRVELTMRSIQLQAKPLG